MQVAPRNAEYKITPEALIGAVRFMAQYLADDTGLAISKTLVKACKQVLGIYSDRQKIWHLPEGYEGRLIAIGVDPVTWFIKDRKKLARAWEQLLTSGALDIELQRQRNFADYEPPQMEPLGCTDHEWGRQIAGAGKEPAIPPGQQANGHLEKQIKDYLFDR